MFRIIWLVLLTLIVLPACESSTEEVAKPIVFASKNAPYSLTLNGNWTLEDRQRLNPFADLAASLNTMVYLIVIPQELPSFDGMEPPDALALRRASITLMKDQVDTFAISKQGPVRIGEVLGQTVFASGIIEKQSVNYITTYVTHDGWGYQIVAWAPSEQHALLVTEVDDVLAHWRFLDKSATTSKTVPAQ